MTTTEDRLEGLDRYRFGWADSDVAGAGARRGLSEEVVRDISAKKSEPEWMLRTRLKALRLFERKPMPSWGADLSGINFDNIKYFVRSTEKQATSWDDLPTDIRNTYDKLGIPEAERGRLIAGVAAQYECLTGDARVWTTHGLVPIKDVHPGDHVFSLDEQTGRFTVAPVRAQAQTGLKPTREVQAGARRFRATRNHPVYALVDARREGRRRARYQARWVTVGELHVGDFVAVPRTLPSFGASRALPAAGTPLAPSHTDPDLMWLLGLFVGDGSMQDSGRTHRVQLAIPARDPELRAEVARVVQRLFGLTVREPADGLRLVVNSLALVRWLQDLGFAGTAHTKQVPGWVVELPEHERLAFLGGWVDADGYVSPDQSGCVLLTSVSAALLASAAELATLSGLRAGGPWSFASPHVTDPDRLVPGLRLGISGDFDRLGCRNPRRLERFGRRRYHHSDRAAHGTTIRAHVTDDLGWTRVTGLDDGDGLEEAVYDIEVDGPHNFVAEGVVVHNSEVVYHQIREDLEAQGVLFLDTDSGLREQEELFRTYFGSVIPPGDNKFAALNTAVWSGGSFIYVPPGVDVEIPLQAYFRINTENMGQFERTLIIADEGSSVHYVEGCLPAGEPVAMADGSWRPIERIEVGDRVLADDGRAHRVNATQVRDFHGELFTFRPVSPGNSFTVTGEHPLLVVPRGEALVGRAARNGWQPEVDSAKLRAATPHYLPASEVAEGDFLVYPKPVPSASTVVFPVEFMRLAGYYLAEGSATLTNGCKSLVFSFHIDEVDYVEEVQTLCKQLYDAAGSVRYDEAKHEARVLIYTNAGYEAMRSHVGTGSARKTLSADLMAQHPDLLSELVETYMAGDGNRIERGGAVWRRAHTTSRSWALQLQAIMARRDTFATVELRRAGGPGEILGRVVTRQDLWQVQWTEQGHGPRVVRDAGDYFLVPVRRRSVTQASCPVYNLDVEAPDSYLASGFAVHNCTAPIYSSDSLHSAVVEIVVKKNARVRYTTIQNWSNNVYNLVTKRTAVHEGGRMEWIDGNIGSKVTMKYPACYLLGERAFGETLSIAFAGEGQHQDAGAKMVHAAPRTSSQIVSKSVARGGGRTSYRGLVQIQEGATESKSTVKCDALLIDQISRSDTYPYVDVRTDDASMGHEATVSKIGADKLFYLMSRGLTEDEAMAMIVRGFVEPIARELPMEYALELNRLIELQMEGAVG